MACFARYLAEFFYWGEIKVPTKLQNPSRNLSVLWVIVLTVLVGCEAQQIQVPTTFTRYDSNEGVFACEYPEGWEAKGGGKNGPIWAKFSSGSALISIKATVAGSLMSDAMGGSSFGEEEIPPQLEPVHGIHENYARDAKEEFNEYTETAGGPAVVNCRLGPARSSEFTASSSFGSSIHGYRATIIGRNKGIVVYCTCPDSEWTKVKPAFDHLLLSFVRGESD